MTYAGDFRLGDTFDVKFCTVTTTGAPTQLAGSPVISAYPGNSTTQLTAGITLSVDFDGVTGLNNVRVVATGGNGYATATNYALVITTGTVGGTSVVGYVVAHFSIEARSALMPTTAARTLNVSASFVADADMVAISTDTVAADNLETAFDDTAGPVRWQGIARQGTAQSVTATTLVMDAAAAFADNELRGAFLAITEATTGAGQTRSVLSNVGSTDTLTVDTWDTTPTGTIKFKLFHAPPAPATPPVVDVTKWNGTAVATPDTAGYPKVTMKVGTGAGEMSISGGIVNADMVKLSTDATAADNAESFFDGTGYAGTNNVIPSVTTVTGNVNGNVTGNVGGNVTGSVGSVAAGGITASSIAADAIGASELATDAVTEIVTGVLAGVIEGAVTLQQSLRISNAANAGKLSGAATTAIAIRDLADTKDRISATVDADGNRTAVTTNLT
jgi:hypothetical protein